MISWVTVILREEEYLHYTLHGKMLFFKTIYDGIRFVYFERFITSKYLYEKWRYGLVYAIAK